LIGCGVLLFAVTGCGATQDQVLGVVPKQPHPAAAKAVAVAAPAPRVVAQPATRKVAVDTYATGVCGGLAEFGTAFHDAKTRRTAALNGSPTAARTALLSYYDALDAAFDRMMLVTRAVGVPKLAHGADEAAGVVATLQAAKQVDAGYRSKAQQLPSAGTKHSRATAQSIAADSDRDVSDAMHRLSQFNSDPAIRKAFTRAKACQHS
jgi:hypothetical protein